MELIEPLTDGKFYHIYNRGINSCNLFNAPTNYEHFLNLYEKYISPVADTFAWVLMPNHFHLLVRIKENIGYKYSFDSLNADSLNADLSNTDRSIDAVRFEEHKWETIELNLSAGEASDRLDGIGQQNNIPQKTPKAHLHFSHLFNAYSKYFNKFSGRHGALFERPFHRRVISDREYFKTMVVYIHNNPVHHGFTEYAMDYPWSSYLSCISIKPTHLQRDAVIGWFDNEANFKTEHDGKIDVIEIEKWLGL